MHKRHSFRSSCACAKYHPGIYSPSIHSNGNCPPQFPEPRSGSACRRITIDYLCDLWCVWPKMWWSDKRLGSSVLSKTISVPWFGRHYWHGGRADNSNKTANNAKYSNCKGLNHETYDVSLQNLRSRPFWILSPFRILFLFILRLLKSYKHDSFCA